MKGSLIYFHPHEVTAITHENDGCVESPNVDTQVSKDIDAIGVVDSYHNKIDFIY